MFKNNFNNISFFNLFVRYWEAYKNGKKSRKIAADSRYYSIYVEQWRDIAMLRLFEAFIESAPQLVLQLYILAYRRHFDEEKDWLTAFSACISLISLSTSIVSYSKALREASDTKGHMSWWAFACQIVWRLSMVGSRIVTLVLFASVYKSWILLFIGLHWSSMTIWLIYQKTSFCTTKTLERLFSVVIGFIYIFCFFNPKDGFTRKRLIFFYCVMLVEDCVLMGMWLPHRHEYGAVFVAAVVMVFGGFFLGILVMFLYYQFYHPSLEVQGIFRRTKHDVPADGEIVRRLLCCGKCCNANSSDDEASEAPTGRPLEVDIPATRGSVGRSVRKDKVRSPTFEKELIVHEPSKLQRQYSLEKQKIKKERAERARRLREQENGMQNETYLEQSQGMEDPEVDLLSNGNASNHEGPQQNGAIAIDICSNGFHPKETEGESGESGASMPTNEKTCVDGLHCGTDDEEQTKKGELKSTLRYKYSSNLNFQHRYSFVSDCISLSSSSSDTTEDEPLKKDVKTRSVRPRTVELENDPSLKQLIHDNNGEISDQAQQFNAQSSSTVHVSQPPAAADSRPKNVISGEYVKRRKTRKRRQANRVSFPNFVATNLKRGKFSSLRLSREDFAEESRVENKRHTVDFSELTCDRPGRKNKYVRLVKRLKPGKFGSVRKELEELGLKFEQKGSDVMKGHRKEKVLWTKSMELSDSGYDVGTQRKTCGMQGTSDSELMKRSETTPRRDPGEQLRKRGDTELNDCNELSRHRHSVTSCTSHNDNGCLLGLKSEDNRFSYRNEPDPLLKTLRHYSEKDTRLRTSSSSTPNKRHTVNFPCFLEENCNESEANDLSPVSNETRNTADSQVLLEQNGSIWMRREVNVKQRDRSRPLSASFAELGIRERFLLLKETPILI